MYNSVVSEHLETIGGRHRLPWLNSANIVWTDDDKRRDNMISERLFAFSNFVNQFDDITTVAEMALSEARDATMADGAMFYIVEPDMPGLLHFAYFQNATLSRGASESQNHYVNVTVPINADSTMGWAALTHRPLNIPSVEHMSKTLEYKFDSKFDDMTGYNTISELTIPVIGAGDRVIAVIRLVNKISTLGVPMPFDQDDERYIRLLSMQVAPHLTKSMMTQRLIETMLRISELRDPEETGVHVQRVGAFAAEIYARWAADRHIDRLTMMRDKDALRIAAMLHDIGKVAIPDAILKKPARLDADEYEVMKTHCARGAQMYAQAESRIEEIAYEITLHHHQRWDGKGYTGDPSVPVLSGEDIPIFARVTSAADVLDALAFPRVYKPAWTFDSVMDELRRCAGTQFDPAVVQAAIEIEDTLRAIVRKYQ